MTTTSGTDTSGTSCEGTVLAFPDPTPLRGRPVPFADLVPGTRVLTTDYDSTTLFTTVVEREIVSCEAHGEHFFHVVFTDGQARTVLARFPYDVTYLPSSQTDTGNRSDLAA